MFKICIHQLKCTLFSPRLYLSLLLGCVVQAISAFPLLEFSKTLGKPLGALEAFIYFNTDEYAAACIFLGAILMVSDIPFSAQNETYTLLRTSRRQWVFGKILYLLAISIVYYLVMLLFSILYISENAFIANTWSEIFPILVRVQAPELAGKYDVYFPYEHIMALSPVVACLAGYLLSVCYAFVMSLIIFLLNLRISKVLSYLAGIMIHVLGYLISIGMLGNYVHRFSLLSHSLLMFHNIGGSQSEVLFPTLIQSFVVYAVIAVITAFLILRAIRNYDFRITVGAGQ